MSKYQYARVWAEVSHPSKPSRNNGRGPHLSSLKHTHIAMFTTDVDEPLLDGLKDELSLFTTHVDDL